MLQFSSNSKIINKRLCFQYKKYKIWSRVLNEEINYLVYRELKTAFAPYGWELTAAVAAGKDKVDAGYDVVEISKYLDAIHLMTYDLHGSWESEVGDIFFHILYHLAYHLLVTLQTSAIRYSSFYKLILHGFCRRKFGLRHI